MRWFQLVTNANQLILRDGRSIKRQDSRFTEVNWKKQTNKKKLQASLSCCKASVALTLVLLCDMNDTYRSGWLVFHSPT